MTCWTRRDWCTGSGSIGRMPAAARRGIWLLGLDAVLRPRLLAVGDTCGVEGSADDLVAHARKILDAPAAHEHHRVLLEVVALARDVGRDLHPVGQAHTGDLAKRRVRLLRGGGVDARADTAALRRSDLLLATLAGLQARGRDLLLRLLASLADELIDAWHAAQDASSRVAARRGLKRGLGRAGLRRAERRRRERRGGDHEHEGEALEHDAERVAGHRIAEDEDAAGDGRDVGARGRE